MSNSAIRFTVDLSGLNNLIAQNPGNVDKGLRMCAEGIVTDIKLSFGASPSPAGSPPGVDTGALRASIRQEKTGAHEYTVMDGVEYGIYHEHAISKPPRPFMTPVFETWRAGKFASTMKAAF